HAVRGVRGPRGRAVRDVGAVRDAGVLRVLGIHLDRLDRGARRHGLHRGRPARRADPRGTAAADAGDALDGLDQLSLSAVRTHTRVGDAIPSPRPAAVGAARSRAEFMSDSKKARALLEVRDLAQHFGGLKAVDQVNLTIREGEIASVIGPNGAGKTTFFNVLTGVYPGTRGEIVFDGRLVRGLPSHEIVARGIARTFQNIRLFPDMTALENVMVGRHTRTSQLILGPLLRTRA